MTEQIMQFLYNIGTAICHQMDLRTFHFYGHPFMVCARDTGTYTGFICTFIYWMIVNKKIKGGIAPTYCLITAGIFIGTLVFDGGTSYLHIRETTNHIRLITGLLAGSGAAILIVPCVFNLLYEYTAMEPFIKKPFHYGGWIFMILLLFIIIRQEYSFLYYPLSLAVTAGICLMITMVNSVVLALFPPWNNKTIKDMKTLWYFLFPALILSFLELYGTYSLHVYMKHLCSGTI